MQRLIHRSLKTGDKFYSIRNPFFEYEATSVKDFVVTFKTITEGLYKGNKYHAHQDELRKIATFDKHIFSEIPSWSDSVQFTGHPTRQSFQDFKDHWDEKEEVRRSQYKEPKKIEGAIYYPISTSEVTKSYVDENYLRETQRFDSPEDVQNKTKGKNYIKIIISFILIFISFMITWMEITPLSFLIMIVFGCLISFIKIKLPKYKRHNGMSR